MFELTKVQNIGLLSLDMSHLLPKGARGALLASGAFKDLETLPRSGDFQARMMVEPANAMFWKHDHTIQKAPRGAWGSWSFAMPYVTKVGALARPLQLHSKEDDDFEDDIVFTVNTYGGQMPQGITGIAASTTNHGPKDKIGVVSGGPLVAHWRGNNPPSYSRHVFDINGDRLDPIRHAGLHTAWEVRRWQIPCSKYAQKDIYAIALNGKASKDGTGHLFSTFPDFDAHLSYSMSGPLRPATKKHELAVSGDGPIHAGAIDTNAYFTSGRVPFDAPLHFKEEPYPVVKDGVTPYEVHLKYDANLKHPFRCGQKPGMWRWYVKLPVSETPPCDSTKDYSTTDANDNPRRTYAEDSRLVLHKKAISTGIYFQPRSNILYGRIRRV